jgi:hypothetical protein
MDSADKKRSILRQFFMAAFPMFTARFPSAETLDFTELTLQAVCY